LRLDNIGMVAGDTSRSRAYLQAMVRNEILPGYVILLDDNLDKSLPGQLDKSQSYYGNQELEKDDCWSEATFDPTQPVKALLDEYQIPYEVTSSKNINDSTVIETIRCRSEAVFIYSGFGGVLLKRDILSTGKKFLHIHGGYLPDFKGSTTNYYSLIEENTLGASAIFLTQEIDSGPILLRKKFPPPLNRLAIDHIYDSAARAKVLVQTLQDYLRNGDWKFALPDNVGGETYYIIHPVLKHMAILDDGSVF